MFLSRTFFSDFRPVWFLPSPNLSDARPSSPPPGINSISFFLPLLVSLPLRSEFPSAGLFFRSPARNPLERIFLFLCLTVPGPAFDEGGKTTSRGGFFWLVLGGGWGFFLGFWGVFFRGACVGGCREVGGWGFVSFFRFWFLGFWFFLFWGGFFYFIWGGFLFVCLWVWGVCGFVFFFFFWIEMVLCMFTLMFVLLSPSNVSPLDELIFPLLFSGELPILSAFFLKIKCPLPSP